MFKLKILYMCGDDSWRTIPSLHLKTSSLKMISWTSSTSTVTMLKNSAYSIQKMVYLLMWLWKEVSISVLSVSIWPTRSKITASRKLIILYWPQDSAPSPTGPEDTDAQSVTRHLWSTIHLLLQVLGSLWRLYIISLRIWENLT